MPPAMMVACGIPAGIPLLLPPAPQRMLAKPPNDRPLGIELFELLGQGEEDLKEILEQRDPAEMESFYRQWQDENHDSIPLWDWFHDQL